MKIRYYFRRKWTQIKRVFDFLPLIWNGFDFDYGTAIDLFKHQLKRTADYIGSDKARALGSKNISSRIKTAVELMDKVYEDYYLLEHHYILEKMHGKCKFNFVETGELDSKGEPYYIIKPTWEHVYGEKDNEEIDRVSRKMAKVGRDKQKRAHKLLWDFIEHNIQRWWD